MDKNYVFVVLSNVHEWGDILVSCPSFLLGTKVNNTSDACEDGGDVPKLGLLEIVLVHCNLVNKPIEYNLLNYFVSLNLHQIHQRFLTTYFYKKKILTFSPAT